MFPTTIKLAIVDDHTLFRRTLEHFLSLQKNIEIIFNASNAFDLMHKLRKNTIDILVSDLFMPQINGNEALSVIRKEYPELKVIVLSMNTDITLVNNLLNIGIHGYISKSDEPEELIKAIYSVADNRIYRNKFLTEALYLGTQNSIKANARLRKVNFDDREKTIIQLLWKEKNNKEIADHLFLSVRSIEKIRQDMKEKIDVKTTVGLLKYALAKKIISLDDPTDNLAMANVEVLNTIPTPRKS